MTTYDHDELGISAAQGNTAFITALCILVVTIHIVKSDVKGIHYKSVSSRLILILVGPAFISICALFGLFWNHVIIGLLIQFYKAIMIAAFTTYLFAFLAAKRDDTTLVYDHNTLINSIMELGKVTHVA